MAAVVVNSVQTVTQGVAVNVPFLHNEAANDAVADITLFKPGGSGFGAVTDGTANRVGTEVYIWEASDVDLDTLGTHIVRIVANGVVEYAFVNVVAAAAVVASPADRPAM